MTEEKTLKVLDHLDELRRRLITSTITVLIGFVVCFYYSDQLLTLLKLPLDYQVHLSFSVPYVSFLKNATSVSLVFIAPAEAFWAHLKIAMVFSVLLASPMLFIQIWLFIKPALFEEEKSTVVPFIVFSILLFILGLTFCFLIVLPFALDFLLGYRTAGLVPMLTLERYIDFMLKFILAFGLIFQSPIIIVLLTKMNIVSIKTLREKRKYAVLIIFIIAAVLTPTPDVFNQCLMAVPLMFLYEVSIIVASILYKE